MLSGTNSGVSNRTWQSALDAIIETKTCSTQDRWRRAANDKALDLIRGSVIIERQAEQLLVCLKAGTVSKNVHLRKLHNFCLSMNWLRGRSSRNASGRKCAFSQNTPSRSRNIKRSLTRKKNPEQRSFYELPWHLGGSRSDIAKLKEEDIDWPNQTATYERRKTGSAALIHFVPYRVILRRMPSAGLLLAYLQSLPFWPLAKHGKP